MKTIKELQDDFNKNGNIKILQSKTPGIGYIKGRFASLLENVPEIIENEFKVWESKYFGSWNTFIKEPPK
tara:strand:+ start:334 stop:543 length:210 start_codon:yes stop_codon:yes gene_type:complete